MLEYEQLKVELNKATQLLAEVPEFPGSVTSYWIYRRDELLARNPAQPAVLSTLEQLSDVLDYLHTQSAAPMPRVVVRADGWYGIPQPAAPTPVGTPSQRFQEWAETHPDNPLRREPAAPERSGDTVPESMHEELRQVMLSERRAKESAEAKLAAVGMVVSRLRNAAGAVDAALIVKKLEQALSRGHGAGAGEGTGE